MLKANQGKACAAVKQYGERHGFHRGADQRPVFDAFEDERGRLVRRRVSACPETASLEALRDWPGLRMVLVMETIRSMLQS